MTGADLAERPVAMSDDTAEQARFGVRSADAIRRRGLERALNAAPPDSVEVDVLVLDLAAGESVPASAAAQAALLVLSDDPELAAQPGLAGVLPRMSTERQVMAAAAAVAEGLMVRVPGALPEAAPTRSFVPADSGPRPLLTPRELEILAEVGQGMSNKLIARRLGISAHTVKYHLEAIFAKLDVRSRAEAVSRGLRHGLLVV